MSLKRNIIASYASQIYVTLVGILILPLYLQYMGVEAYGLVGFYTMLQVWFNLLDMGLTPTVARETARFRGGTTDDALRYRRLLRGLQVMFFAIALLGGSMMYAFSDSIAERWLNAQTLPLEQVRLALQLMAIGVALRWVSGFYRGYLLGAEQLVWLAGFNSFFATIRYAGIVPILVFINNSIEFFFIYQILVAIAEVVILLIKFKHLNSEIHINSQIGWSPKILLNELKKIIKFTSIMTLSSIVWIAITQTDKLILSKIIPLTEYAYFYITTLAASSVTLISNPISNSLLPRMVLSFSKNREDFLKIYSNATQWICIVAMPACAMLSIHSEKILLLWTNNQFLAEKNSLTLSLYSLGNGLLIISSIPYFIQYSAGKLRLHLLGTFIFLLILILSLMWKAERYGGEGAGWIWLVLNAIYLFFWTPLIHHIFLPNIHWDWIKKDTLPIITIAFSAAWITTYAPWPKERFSSIATLIITGAVVFFLTSLGSSSIREKISLHLREKNVFKNN